jgi:Kef-type K+ transport system membrane component KefB
LEIENLLLVIVVSLVFAKILGEVFRRLKQPALVGELLAGVILGPSLLGFFQKDESFSTLTGIAVFFLMFLAGLQMNLSEIRKASRSAVVIAIAAFTIPFLSGYYVGSFFGLTTVQSMFVGLLLSITALPVSSMILMEFGILRSRVGTIVMTEALINDVISMFVLSFIILYASDAQSTTSYSSLALTGAKIAVFFAVIGLIVYYVKWIKTRSNKFEILTNSLKTKEATLALLVIAGISVSLLAHYSSLHFIIGAFFAGLVFGKDFWGEKVHQHHTKLISGMTFGFFAPLFFVFIGAEFNVASLAGSMPFFLALFGVAVATKIFAGYFTARLVKFSNNESLAIGCLINGRGMVEIAIAAIGYSMGLIDLTLFTIVIAIGFLTTIMAPLLARPFVYRYKMRSAEPEEHEKTMRELGQQA